MTIISSLASFSVADAKDAPEDLRNFFGEQPNLIKLVVHEQEDVKEEPQREEKKN